MRPRRLAILLSGRGSNFEAIADSVADFWTLLHELELPTDVGVQRHEPQTARVIAGAASLAADDTRIVAPATLRERPTRVARSSFG